MANVALCVWRANRSLYGADKLATAMRKAGHDVGRDQAARLMRIVGIEGARRGKHTTTTTRRDPAAARHPDLVRRRWRMPTRPDQWWVADFTYVWTLEGFVYTSFVSDVCSRRILGWRVSSSKATPLVMAALEQALFTRRRGDARFTAQGLVFHSDAGSQPRLKGSSTRGSPPRSAPSATPWTTLSSNQQSACTRPSSSSTTGPGAGPAEPTPNRRPPAGSTGSTRPGSTTPSGSARRSSSKSTTVRPPTP